MLFYMINIYYKTFKEFIKNGYRVYFLFFEGEIEKTAVEVGKYTKRFIILKDIRYNEKDFEPHISLECKCMEQLNHYLDGIINKRNIFISDVNIKNKKNAIVIIDSNSDDYKVKLYEMLYLFDLLPKEYYIESIDVLEEGLIFFKFTNNCFRVDFNCRKKPGAVFIGNGIGDLCIIGSSLIEFLKQFEKTYIIIPQKCKVADMLPTELLPNCTICKFDNIRILEKVFSVFSLSGQFEECYDLFFVENKYNNTYLHYHDLFVNQTDIAPCINPYKNESVLKKAFLDKVISEEILWVDSKINKEKKNVAIQFWTDEPTSNRCWDRENVSEFCNMCSDIQLFNLTPYPSKIYGDIKLIDAGHLSIFGIMYLISKVDCVIGIDSCCGHIAALFNIPSVTLWNDQTPSEFISEMIKMSFRPLRKNYSIVPKNGDISSIDYCLVFEIMIKIIEKEILFDESVISISDTLANKNILHV